MLKKFDPQELADVNEKILDLQRQLLNTPRRQRRIYSRAPHGYYLKMEIEMLVDKQEQMNKVRMKKLPEEIGINFILSPLNNYGYPDQNVGFGERTQYWEPNEPNFGQNSAGSQFQGIYSKLKNVPHQEKLNSIQISLIVFPGFVFFLYWHCLARPAKGNVLNLRLPPYATILEVQKAVEAREHADVSIRDPTQH